MRIDYEWDGEETNLSDKVPNWVKMYLFPWYKFLKDGWMEYREEDDSLSSFTQERLFNGLNTVTRDYGIELYALQLT